jgi:hypothetical protein
MVQFLEETILNRLAAASPNLETAMSKRQCKSKLGTFPIWGLIYKDAVEKRLKNLENKGVL